jgi:hydroxymethylbilane synthase
VTERVVIATRGSELALWQAEHVKARLRSVAPGLQVDLQIIKTQGDKILDIPLAEIGGKALFVKEIEQALLDRTADIAVHSMKDVPAELAPGLALAAVSTRETPWDALCAREPVTVATLPKGAKIGTSSTRRQAQLLAARPDLQIALLRGNVPTRLKKLDAGEYDAIILAAAGLLRLGLGRRITQLLPLELSIPAVTQGVLGIETRADDVRTAELVRRALLGGIVERAFLDREDGGLRVVGMCGMPDGTKILRAEVEGSRDDAERLGTQLAETLLARGADAILAATGSPAKGAASDPTRPSYN